MTSDHPIDLKEKFEGRGQAAKEEQGEMPERIKNHAPTPVLRPEGSWAARADAIDQAVRERMDAAKARNEWAARLKPKPGQRRKRNKGYRRSVR